MTYEPFIEDPTHIKILSGQRFVVLRAPVAVSAPYRQVQSALRERLRGEPVSYPARAHVTLCGLAAGTPLHAVQELVRGWSAHVSPLRIEIERVSWFPPPFQIVIVEVRRTPALVSAFADLRTQAEEQGLVVSTVLPVEQWRFHMSVVYCAALSEPAWQEVARLAEVLRLPPAQDEVGVVEVAAFDDGREYAGGVYPLRASPTEERR